MCSVVNSYTIEIFFAKCKGIASSYTSVRQYSTLLQGQKISCFESIYLSLQILFCNMT
jgi:hypothetical protein